MTSPRTLLEAIQCFADVDAANDYFASIRWPNGPSCPRCECREYSYLKKRRLWQCKACRYQYSVKKGSIFEDSALPLAKWLPAVWLIANCRNGISSHELARSIGVSQKSAWHMLHRIRLAMQTGTFEKWTEKFDGAVEVDETYIGGKARNMHAHKRKEISSSNFSGKTGVLGFRQRGGDVAVTVIDSTKRHRLHPEIRKRVKPGATVITDELSAYRRLDESYEHLVVNHADTYVDGQVHTNGLENFWALLKRGLGGTYVSVRPFHLFRYLDEQVYRYNAREGEDRDRFEGVLEMASGRRVTWKELTAKETKKDDPPHRPPQRRRRRVYPTRPFRELDFE